MVKKRGLKTHRTVNTVYIRDLPRRRDRGEQIKSFMTRRGNTCGDMVRSFGWRSNAIFSSRTNSEAIKHGSDGFTLAVCFNFTHPCSASCLHRNGPRNQDVFAAFEAVPAILTAFLSTFNLCCLSERGDGPKLLQLTTMRVTESDAGPNWARSTRTPRN